MILDQLSYEDVLAAEKLKLNPHSSAVTKVDDLYIALDLDPNRDNRLIGQQTRKFVAKIPTIGWFGKIKNQHIGSMEFTVSDSEFLNVSPIECPSNVFILAEMLKYAETIAWLNELKGITMTYPTYALDGQTAIALRALDYHVTKVNANSNGEEYAILFKDEVVPHKFKSDYQALYTQATGKKIKTQDDPQRS